MIRPPHSVPAPTDLPGSEEAEHTPIERDLRLQLRIVEKVIDASLEGIIICDQKGLIQSVNRAFTQITGYSEAEALGQNPSLLSSGRHAPDFYQQMWASLEAQGFWQGEIWNRNKAGQVYPEWLSITSIENESGEVVQYAAIFHDLTEIKRSEARLKQMARFDQLTRLANRQLFYDRLQQALAWAKVQQRKITLIQLDLDWFKVINDRYGHEAGDQLLQTLAQRVQLLLDSEDTAARPSGDEFSLVLHGPQTHEDLLSFLNRLRQVICVPQLIAGQEVRITASMGVAVFPEDAQTAETLVGCADLALEHAKYLGRNGFHFYSQTLHRQSRSRFQLANLLQNALVRGELHLFYQPKVHLASNQICGVEALLRWFSPELGGVSPADFIPLAEDMGLIDQIGDWVLEAAVRQAKEWSEAGTPLNIAVNVSARQFQRGDVAVRVLSLLARYQLEPEWLSIELTETSFLHSPEKTRVAIEQLTAAGVKVAIDDFGTGYSSLSYIRTMSLHQLKVDISFIRHLAESERDRKLVEAIIAMAHALDLEVVAEGVEDAEQLRLLAEIGCDQAQGYQICRPAPPESLIEWLLQR
ncbi:putative bifunctional diguanylate cyclase/phosphodiesterase [Nitrincola tapanii]|uniref:putative bifunctional diguanylate cyclase/phosphodiesterase n=1 Tax=Nitrincola tapanii TaxID=1708751 RepID=UPI00135B8F26|nr:EAL domain-containing protein [Nitrincola tapanii]